MGKGSEWHLRVHDPRSSAGTDSPCSSPGVEARGDEKEDAVARKHKQVAELMTATNQKAITIAGLEQGKEHGEKVGTDCAQGK